MDEKQGSFNLISGPLSDNDIVMVLRAAIINFCGKYPDHHQGYFEIKTIGNKEFRNVKGRLEAIPGVLGAMHTGKSKSHNDERIIRINKTEFIDYFRPDHLKNTMDFIDRNAWNRLEELADITKRDWSQSHSPVYATEVVQLANASPKLEVREEQVAAMAQELLGKKVSATGEAKDWVKHLARSEDKAERGAKTALPSSWVTRKNVATMSAHLILDEAAQKKLQETLSRE